MLKKIFFFLILLATVYCRNISSAHQIFIQKTKEKFSLNDMVISDERLSDGYYATANLREKKSKQIPSEIFTAASQGHGTHLP